MAAADSRIHLLSEGTKRGARDAFFWLLSQVMADYYMFADHDDVWLPEKVQATLDAMLAHPEKETRPLIACTDLCIVDERLQVINESHWARQSITHRQLNSKYYHLFYDNVTGCTMLLNARAKEVSLPYPPEAIMHDAWVAAAVLWNGGAIIPVDKPYILYRQHGNNVVGVHNVPTFAKQLKNFKIIHEKTLKQFKASRSLTRMPYFSFVLLKIYYSILIHIKH